MIDAREFARKAVLSAARYSGISTAFAPFLSGVGAILMLHRVNRGRPSPLGLNSHLSIQPGFLDALLRDLKRRGYDLVSLDEMTERLAGSESKRFVAITADDAYLDNLTEALPVLEAHDAPFAIYVAPALTSGEVLPWWEIAEEIAEERDSLYLPTADGLAALDCSDIAAKKKAAARVMDHLTREVAEEDQQRFLAELADMTGRTSAPGGARRFMDWDEIRRLAGHPLATIGAHTVHHYNLKRIAAEDVLREMKESAVIIERETGRRPRHFAYPYGYEAAVGAREVALAAEAGFATAVTTRHGVLQAGHASHLHALPRISVNGNFQRLGYVRTLLSGLTTPLSNGGKRLVTV